MIELKIHVVTKEMDVEGGIPVKAFSDKTKAEAFAKECDSDPSTSGYWHDVETIELEIS